MTIMVRPKPRRGPHPNRPWTVEQIDRLRELYLTGADCEITAFARECGRTRRGVAQAARKLGLRRPSPTWTPAEDAIVREHYGRAQPTSALADRLSRGRPAVRRRARVLGVTARWTPAEVEAVRTRYQTDGARSLARDLLGGDGLTAVAVVYRLASKLGVASPVRHPPEVIDRVRSLHAEGFTDTRVAAAMAGRYPGFNGRNDRERVTAIRRRLGLAPNRPDFAAAVKKQMAVLGLDGPSRLRDRAQERLARRYGLPPDLRPRQVEIVLALAGGPLTVPEIRERTGIRSMLCNRRKVGGMAVPGKTGTYLSDLAARGLVARTSTGVLPRSAAPKWKYLLTAAAIELLAAAGGVDADTPPG